MTPAQAAARFGVSVRTVERYTARRRATGRPDADCTAAQPGPEVKQLQTWLPARLQQAADATSAEHAAIPSAESGVLVSRATTSRSITALPADDPGQAVTPSGVG